MQAVGGMCAVCVQILWAGGVAKRCGRCAGYFAKCVKRCGRCAEFVAQPAGVPSPSESVRTVRATLPTGLVFGVWFFRFYGVWATRPTGFDVFDSSDGFGPSSGQCIRLKWFCSIVWSMYLTRLIGCSVRTVQQTDRPIDFDRPTQMKREAHRPTDAQMGTCASTPIQLTGLATGPTMNCSDRYIDKNAQYGLHVHLSLTHPRYGLRVDPSARTQGILWVVRMRTQMEFDVTQRTLWTIHAFSSAA